MDAIKYTSKAVLPADMSIHRIICIKFFPASGIYSAKGSFIKLKVFPSFVAKDMHHAGIFNT